MKNLPLPLTLFLCLGPAWAQENSLPAGSAQETTTVRVRVLWVQDGLARIDLGATSGLKAGDRVVLEPLGASEVTAEVIDLGPGESTLRLPPGATGIVAGVRGRVLVPVLVIGEPRAGTDRPPIEWSEESQAWQGGATLLEPIEAGRPEQRPTVWSGDVHLGGNTFRDATGSDRSDDRYWVGTRLRGQNPFGRGGDLELVVDYEARSLSVDGTTPGLEDNSDSYLRVSRASYVLGGTRFDHERYEMGRFFPRDFAELGLLDGFEWSRINADGTRYGASAGFQPGFGPDLPFEDNLAISGFWQALYGSEDRSRLGAAVQQTWYGGSADRTWALMKGHWEQARQWFLDGRLAVDWYDSADAIKSSGLEVTDASVHLERRFDRTGACYIEWADNRWPETQRALPALQDPDLLIRAHTTRSGVGGWYAWNDKQRSEARFQQWEDETDSGSFGEVSFEQQASTGLWTVAAYWNDAPFSTSRALRLSHGADLWHGRYGSSLEVGSFDLFDPEGTTTAESRVLVRGFWGGTLMEDLFGTLDAAVYTGGEQDAWSLGFTLRRSF
ncbi:MAG: hypothetical protein R3F33_10925 [Planctomycetota bacterium]